MENVTQTKFKLENFALDLAIKNQCLVINIQDNMNRKIFYSVYSFQNLPSRIKIKYKTLLNFMQDIEKIIHNKDYERIKLLENGRIIAFNITQIVGDKQIMTQQFLVAQQKLLQIDNKAQEDRKFHYEKQKKFDMGENFNNWVPQFYQKCIKQSQLIERLQNRIEALQNAQKQKQKIQTDQKKEQTQMLKKWMEKVEMQLKNCVQKKKRKENDENKQNLTVQKIGQQQEILIDGFYCTFQLKKNQLKITLIKQENNEQFIIIVDQEQTQKIPCIKTAQKLYREIIFITQNQKIEERIKISQSGFLTIKFVVSMEGVQDTIEEVFKPQNAQCSDIQRLQYLIQIKNKELLKTVRTNYIDKVQSDMKKWTQKLFFQHQNNEHSASEILISEMRQELQIVRKQILGLQQHQKINLHPQKPMNLKKLHQLIQVQQDKFYSFINSFSEQLTKIHIQNQIQQKMADQKIITRDLFCFRKAIQISNILQSKYDCLRLFSLFPERVKQIKQLFKASQHNFQVQKFHKNCDGIPHTITLVKTEYGKTIGGYTPLKWESNSGWACDTKSFLFSLTSMDKFINNGYSIMREASCGPIFGCGSDLRICNQANIHNNSYANIGSNYKNQQNYPCNQKETWLKYSGSPNKNFRTIQWQVYSIVFEEHDHLSIMGKQKQICQKDTENEQHKLGHNNIKEKKQKVHSHSEKHKYQDDQNDGNQNEDDDFLSNEREFRKSEEELVD